MKGNGKMIFNMGKEQKAGLMDLSMKVNMLMVENMVLDATNGMMVHNIVGNGLKTRSQE